MSSKNDQMVLMDDQRIERTVNRMAHQVVEDVEDSHVLKVVGIQERGYYMAQRLYEILDKICHTDLTCDSISVKDNGHDQTSSFDIENIDGEKDFILLVDDVIFSGSTMFRATQTITEKQLPDHLHCAVLIDRGHRQLPVEAKYIGLNIPTKLNEHVAVEVGSDGLLQEVNLFFNT